MSFSHWITCTFHNILENKYYKITLLDPTRSYYAVYLEGIPISDTVSEKWHNALEHSLLITTVKEV